MSKKQIPVIVLAGFLGSGKTTLLNHLLAQSRGTRIGAIVNDFGAIEIDAMAVAGQLGDSTVSLGNGCLCCAVDASELDEYLEKLTRPAARLDVIVIEASGLAEPQELVRMVLASENERIVYGGLAEVVDAVEFDATRERHPELDRHLAVADLVVLNKTDRVGEEQLGRVLDTVGELSGGTAVVRASYGRIDPELLFDPAVRPDGEEKARQLSFDDLRSEQDAHDCHDDHLHAAYESVSFTSDLPMDPRRLIEFLDTRPEGLYRIKGYVDFGAADARNRYGVHAVGRFLRFYPEPWGRDEPRLTQLVLIGSGTDGDALGKELAECRTSRPQVAGPEHDAPLHDAPRHAGPQDAPAAADEHSMWGVLRYVQGEG